MPKALTVGKYDIDVMFALISTSSVPKALGWIT